MNNAVTLIGTTIHDEPVHIVTSRRYWTVTVDTIKVGGAFGGVAEANAFALKFVPAHRLAA